jgi:hypothetical protein
MSKYRVLYYPLFEPKPTWLRSTLLFVDGIERIIPKDAGHTDSRHISALREAISPDPAPPIEPVTSDLWINQSDLDLMMRGFKLIVSKQKTRHNARTNDIQLGDSFIHRAKIPQPVMRLLEQYKLISTPSRKRKGASSTTEMFVFVQSDAAELIMSYIADRIARRKGIDAITDFEIGFSINALENQGVGFRPSGLAEGYLLSSIVSCEIPAELRYLSSDSYLELRNSFSEIRSAFKRLTAELVVQNRLNRIGDAQTFAEEIQQTVNDFVRECDEYRRSRFAKKIKRWTPLSVGSLIGIVASLGGPVAAVGGRIAQFSTQVIDKKINHTQSDPSRTRAFQMLCDLQDNVLKRSPVKKFLHL